jgi:photosystem II stability/assembly factor-like uncharacterized protein
MAVFANNSRIYAATSCGLHSTGSLSDKWDLKSTLAIETFVKKENMLYFGGSKSGIERINLSEPGFVPSSNGLDGVSVITLKDGGTCLYAGIEGQGFCKSMGYTGEWTFYNLGLPAETAYYPPEQGGGSYYIRHANSIEIIDSTLYCATHAGVYKANMKVMTWSISGKGLPAENVHLLKVIGNYIFACINTRLYYSSDKGGNWNLLFDAGSRITSIHGLNDYLTVTTFGNGIFYSEDHGLTWKTMNDGLTDLKVNMLTVINNTPICGTETQGVFYHNGASWVNHSAGIICSDIKSMGISGNFLAANDPNEVYLADGKVSSWTTITPAAEKAYFGFINTMGNKIFLSYKTNDGGQFIKYSNGDNSWQDLNSRIPFAGDDPYKMCVNGNRLYIYENGIIYFTDDLGATWSNLTYPERFCNDVYDLVVYKNIPFSASCGNGELLRLSGNREWGLSNDGLPNAREITSMAYSDNALYAYSYTNGIFVSTDEGKSWTKATDGFYTDWNIRSFASYKDNIFVSTVKGVFYSTDLGQHWNLMNEGLKNNNTGPLVIYKDTLYVGTKGNGVWMHDLMDFLPPKEDSTAKMVHIKIYPNPATATIRFDFKGAEKANIKLLDLLGREMIHTKLGTDRQLSVAGLSSGTYIIVINNSQYVYTTKVVIKREE